MSREVIHWTFNPGHVGSSPTAPTKMKILRESKPTETRYLIRLRQKTVARITVHDNHVQDLDVSKDYRRRGFATQLMRRVVEDFGHRTLTLAVEPDEENGKVVVRRSILRRFYRKFGFQSDPAWRDWMTRKRNRLISPSNMI